MKKLLHRLYDKLAFKLADSVGRRYLRERDQAWMNGDRLATSVQAHLRGQIDLNGLRDALVQYAEDQSWGGPAMNFIIRDGDRAGQLDVVSANRD